MNFSADATEPDADGHTTWQEWLCQTGPTDALSTLRLLTASPAGINVTVWYLMMGRWTPLEEIEPRLHIKIGKLLSDVTAAHLQSTGKDRKHWREEIASKPKSSRVYVLHPAKRFNPQPAPAA